MTFLKRLTDRLVLRPSTHRIDSGELKREMIPVDGGHLEAWTTHWNPGGEHPAVVIKFPGNGGRAERSTPNPAHLWESVASQVWTINPFGYGGSSGSATLQRYPEMVSTVYEFLRARFPDHRLVVYGRSLGSISALAMASRYPVDGLYLRDPVPIHQMISTRLRYAIPSLGLSRMVAWQIPETLDAVTNAGRCESACLFVTSGADTVVPPKFQNQVVEEFAGLNRQFVIPGANHHDGLPESLVEPYLADVKWLEKQVLGE